MAVRRFPWFRFLLMCVIGFLMTVPFLWMVSASFKPHREAEEAHIVPEEPTLRNYPIVLDVLPDPVTGAKLDMHYGRWYFNSILVTFGIALFQVTTSAMAAYAFSRIRWKGRDRVFLLYLATMMIPPIVTMIPNFQIMVGIGFLNNQKVVIGT